MRRSRRRILRGLVVAAIGLAVLWQADRFTTRAAMDEGARTAETALRLTAQALAGHLGRYEEIPGLIADHDRMHRLFAAPGDPARRAEADAWLKDRNATLGSSDLYVMDRTGTAIAASNHDRTDSFVGQNFRYRPYFTGAMAGGPGRFYGLGTTSGVRGYYFSAPVRGADGAILGAVALKVTLDMVEAGWREGGPRIAVSDPEGIIFLASDPAWLYRGLRPLTEERLARTQASRRYADAALRPLGQQESEEAGVPLMSLVEGAARQDYITAAAPMPEADWTVHVALNAAPYRQQARLALTAFALLICATALAALIVQERRARTLERLAMQSQARAELEGRVAARTADLARLNDALASEVTERKATERELRRTQANLVQAGKLAALGQMSAALSHEINQPLAAARNYADSAGILIDRGDLTRARENVGQILSLIDRMAAIGHHLRDVARKPNEKLVAVSLEAVMADTLVITAPRIAAAGAMVETALPDGLPPVKAGPVRLQQVLANLIANAADAVESRADRRITVSAGLEPGGRQVAIRIRDRGPGVPPAIMERIFDPFFTTKGVGAGLGLGLSISFNILRDFGGAIAVANLPAEAGGGAEFTVTLDAAHPQEKAA